MSAPEGTQKELEAIAIATDAKGILNVDGDQELKPTEDETSSTWGGQTNQCWRSGGVGPRQRSLS
eukprot:1244989-Pyramimonas_sp.AAC.1